MIGQQQIGGFAIILPPISPTLDPFSLLECLPAFIEHNFGEGVLFLIDCRVCGLFHDAVIGNFSLGFRVFLGRPSVKDVEDVIHPSFVEIQRFKDDGIDGVVHIIVHKNKINRPSLSH